MMFEAIRMWLGSMSRPAKRVIAVGFDVVALVGVVWISYALRYGTFFVPQSAQWLRTKNTNAVFVKPILWCPEEDSNFHTLRYTDLNRARLPNSAIWARRATI